MKNLFCIAALALGFLWLCACAQYQILTGASVSPNSVYIASNAFDAAESSAKNYDSLPTCAAGGPLICKTSTAVKAVDAAVRAGRSARNALEDYVNSNPGQVVPVANYQTLMTAVNTIATYVSLTGASQ